MLGRRQKSKSATPSGGRSGSAAGAGRHDALHWTGDEELVVGGTAFDLTVDPATWGASSSAERFVLLKTRRMIESFVDHVPDTVRNIVDLGIFKGGSVAFCSELFHPDRIVGIDLTPDRVDALDEFVARESLSRSVHLHYGTDQGDAALLEDVVLEEFGEEHLDLVVDDCSHTYGPTRASLNVLLPRLRPGGVYVIEDWGWAHWQGERWQGPASQYADEVTPLSKLVLELVMVAASRPELIRELTIRSSQVFLTRGDETVPADGFDISGCYLTAGRTILP